MALEALAEAKFSHKSDVFAFGVLLWETLSLGQTPWGAFAVQDFVGALQRGERLQFPPAVAEDPEAQIVYGVCTRCWASTPRKRPQFVQLENELAVQVAVAMATRGGATAPSAGTEGAAVSVATARVGDVGARSSAVGPSIDADGYVEEPIEFSRANAPYERSMCARGLDENGYVTEHSGLALQVSELDEDGYVANTNFVEPQLDFRNDRVGATGTPGDVVVTNSHGNMDEYGRAIELIERKEESGSTRV
jgi:hypothetical protein